MSDAINKNPPYFPPSLPSLLFSNKETLKWTRRVACPALVSHFSRLHPWSQTIRAERSRWGKFIRRDESKWAVCEPPKNRRSFAHHDGGRRGAAAVATFLAGSFVMTPKTNSRAAATCGAACVDVFVFSGTGLPEFILRFACIGFLLLH